MIWVEYLILRSQIPAQVRKTARVSFYLPQGESTKYFVGSFIKYVRYVVSSIGSHNGIDEATDKKKFPRRV